MSFNWRDKFGGKLVPAARAVGAIKPGSRVYIGSACGEPQALVRAMVDASHNLADTELMQVLTLGVAPYTDPKFASIFRANAFFIGTSVRDAVNRGGADYTPMFLSQVPGLLKSRRLPLDVAMISVSPPDEHGYCSLGVSVDITKAATEAAKVVIAQVNANMPRAGGNCFVHVDEIEYLVEHDEPLLEWPIMDDMNDVTQRIAANVSRLVQDGCTLQTGIGRIPDAVLGLLTDRNDLGVHTEMFSDGVLKLADLGVINGKHKSYDTGKIVGSFAAGSRALFEFMHDNPMVEMHPSDYTNNPFNVARHDRLVAINSALEIDLTGQVCADSLGQHFFSGIGGHADFMRGAAMAKEGKPIIAMPSTAHTPDGLHSRIVPVLSEGAGVVTTRGDVHYVVTEYGVAYLHGKNLRERAMSLINIAHPQFRTELLYAAKRRRLVYRNQILPPPAKPYPADLEVNVTLRDDSKVLIRPIRPDDEPMMKEMFYSFSEKTKYLRYHGTLKSMPHNRLQVFCNVDYDTEMALVGVTGEADQEDVVGVGRYMTDASRIIAEMAFVVRDDWQRKGLGTVLFNRLIEVARQQGIRRFHAEVLTENSGMLKIFHRSGLKVETTTSEGVVGINMELQSKAQA